MKPGYGLKDAPRLWNRALTQCITEFGLKAMQSDGQLFIKHVHGSLVLIVSTHVDDLKLGGIESEVSAFVVLLESRFDSLKQQRNSFEHLGLVHTQTNEYIEIHQNQYIAQLRVISSANIPKDDETDLGEDLHAAYMSLLGGVGWAVQSRPDVVTYVGALQRNLKKPKAKHLRRLNRVVRYLQTHPMCIRYYKIPAPTKIGVISDSAFKAEDPDCLAIKSGIIGLMVDRSGTFSGQMSPVEWVSRKQQHVCRSTYASELHSSLDMVGRSMVIGSAFNEIMWVVRVR